MWYFFQNKDCPYFPCHKVDDIEQFNCLFCYCPLYALGDACGGNFRILENNTKDCSACTLCHKKMAHEYILKKFEEIKVIENKNRSKFL